jgi:hypothetical protein
VPGSRDICYKFLCGETAFVAPIPAAQLRARHWVRRGMFPGCDEMNKGGSTLCR